MGEEIKNDAPVIMSSVPINELIIPSSLNVDKWGNITTWCGQKVLIKLIHHEISFKDGDIKGKKIQNLYMEIDDKNDLEGTVKVKLK